jgi:hypothetical protein
MDIPTRAMGEVKSPQVEMNPDQICFVLKHHEGHAWTMKFIVSVVEVWAGRRQPAQLISWCHRVIYMELLRASGSQKEIGKIKSIHQSEPLDGICESTALIRYGERLRAVVIRFEGVDGRWLCTALKMI